MSRSVDGIVLEGLLSGAGVADEIKRVRPRLPIVMIAENLELPDGALRSVDGLVTKSDGPVLVGDCRLRTADKAGFPTRQRERRIGSASHSRTGESDGNHRRSSSS